MRALVALESDPTPNARDRFPTISPPHREGTLLFRCGSIVIAYSIDGDTVLLYTVRRRPSPIV